MLKSYWWVVVVVAHVIIVSAPVQKLGFWVFSTWSDLRVRIWGLLGQGIGDLDLGLTIRSSVEQLPLTTDIICSLVYKNRIRNSYYRIHWSAWVNLQQL